MESDCSDERKFLHEVANPVATALFIVDALAEEVSSSNVPSELADQLREAAQALNKVQTLIKQRREILISKGVRK